MRFRTAIVFILLLGCLLSGCTSRGEVSGDVPSAPASETGKKSDSKAGKTASVPPETNAPASGTDLLIPEPWSDSAAEALEHARNEAEQSGSVCCLVFAGFIPSGVPLPESILSSELLSETSIPERFPFIPEITASHCADKAFSELYCLVPGAEIVRVQVFRQEMDEESEPTGKIIEELLTTEDNDPVLFSVDSNGWGGSNVLVRLTDTAGKETEFCPALLCNLLVPAPADGVLDLTAQ